MACIKALLVLSISLLSLAASSAPPPAAEPRQANFVDLCEEVDCCTDYGDADDASNRSTYYFIETTRTIHEHLVDCRALYGGRLAIIETQRENDCLVEYILDQANDNAVHNYAIGLETPSELPGIWRWIYAETEEEATTSFKHWAPTHPTATLTNTCAMMGVGTASGQSGFWQSAPCSTGAYLAICEKPAEALL